MNTAPPPTTLGMSKYQTVKSAVVRFAGDSGDGMQVVGEQFTSSTAVHGNDLATLPDYPAEIRAPAGTLFGVSGFQIQFGSDEVYTPGDTPDVLVAMNPAALRANLQDLRPNGLLVINADAFNPSNLEKAGYVKSPLSDGSLANYAVLSIEISRLTNLAVKPAALGAKDAGRCKNFWTLGLALWLYGRPLEPTVAWIERRYSRQLALANVLALKAGNAYGETNELFHYRYDVPAAKLPPGTYRSISGNAALAWGLLAASQRAARPLVLGSYPITPASDLLHELSKHARFGVTTVQAEDEIAAVCVALGAAYAGSIGVTTTSGPGLALKMEAIGLAVAIELPLVVVDVQRAGPSTGLPTKTEQADLLQAVFGRPGESPVCVLAPKGPGDCFDIAFEAVRLAIKYMTPVILLSDGALANGAEPWRIPRVASLPEIVADRPLPPAGQYQPYARDEDTLARAWVTPGNRGYEYRIGGLEKDALTGNISYDPLNHERMTRLRASKIQGIANDIPLAQVEYGPDKGGLLVLGWGSSYGPIHEAVRRVTAKGCLVSHLHLRHLNPFPRNLSELLDQFDRVVVPELNLGQLSQLIQARLGKQVHPINKVQGRPFSASELERHFLMFTSH
ncbi:MAG TPA: 2-oxoacid:acceptor oxidoreductase subunit alpha [Polyangiaceae bacterium]